MEWIKELFSNYILMSGFIAWLLAQLLKVPTGLYRNRKFSMRALFFGNGGMPSSHSATVCSLTCSSALLCGFDSPQFAICFVLALIVMNDAVGVRRETGEQAKVLNRIVADMPEDKTDGMPKDMKELVGHTPLQVLIGGLIGTLTPFILRLFPWFHVPL